MLLYVLGILVGAILALLVLCDVEVEKVMFAGATSSDVHDGSEVSTTREVCDHADRIRIAYSDVYYVDIGYRYCPKCGEKL